MIEQMIAAALSAALLGGVAAPAPTNNNVGRGEVSAKASEHSAPKVAPRKQSNTLSSQEFDRQVWR